MSQRRKGRDRGRGGGGGPPGSLPFFWGAGERGGGPSCLAWRRLQPFWFFIPPPPLSCPKFRRGTLYYESSSGPAAARRPGEGWLRQPGTYPAAGPGLGKGFLLKTTPPPQRIPPAKGHSHKGNHRVYNKAESRQLNLTSVFEEKG